MLVNSKSLLAKLLASENIVVEHRKTTTAYFDTMNRVMVLPMWKEMSPELYDLFLGHETGHALFTPNEGWHDNLKDKTKKGFKTYLNVIEDVRIEKLIQNKFQGLKPSFRKGYSELMEKDFFGVEEYAHNIEELPLIDRINLHYKIGSYLNVQFSEEEMQYINLIDNMKNWEDVVAAANAVYEYGKGELRKALENQFHKFKRGTSSDEGDDFDDYDYDDSDEDEDDLLKEGKSNTKGAGSTDLDPESLTDSHFRNKEKDLIDPTFKPYVYVDAPKAILENIILPYTEIKKYFNDFKTQIGMISEKEIGSVISENKEKIYKQFLQTNQKYISYLIKEFELRRNARQFARANVSKTGELDMKKIHNYKLNDDLFKRMTVVPKGKSHGLVMFIDYSGSMHDNILGTIEQTLVLSIFCRKVNIPFRVYAFSDNRLSEMEEYFSKDTSYNSLYDIYGRKIRPKFTQEQNEIDMNSEGFHLREYLSNEMSGREFKDAVQYWLLVGACYANRIQFGQHKKYMINPYLRNSEFENLNGTPLNEAVLSTIEIVKRFKKQYRLDVVNTVFLTDGEGNETFYKHDGSTTKSFVGRWDTANIVIRDKRNLTEVKVKAGVELTVGCLDLLKAVTGVNIIGFYLTPRNAKKAILHRMTKTGMDISGLDENLKELRKNKFCMINNAGYDDYYFIPGGEDLNIEEDEIVLGTLDANQSKNKNELKKAFLKMQKNKSVNRVLLNRFVQKIA